MALDSALKELAEAIEHSNKNAADLARVRATLFVMFGPSSRSLERYGFQLNNESYDEPGTTSSVLNDILNRLTEQVEQARKVSK